MSDRLKVGIVGYGNHVRKNIARLFDLADAPHFAAIHVRDPARYRAAYPDHAALFAGDLAAMLADPALGAIYIATPISSHAALVRAALDAGKHVWCEKPLTLSADDTAELVALAAANGLMLAEISAYRYHAQFAAVRALLAAKQAAGARLVNVRARFTIPELPADDIRYNAALGGGALLDVGYYPLSIMAALFGAPISVAASGYHCAARGVDLSGSAALGYPGFASDCLWAIGAAYGNELELSFSDGTYLVPRAFSKPPGLATAITTIAANGAPGEPIAVAADDQFANMFAHFTDVIARDDHARFAELGAEAVLGAQVIDRVRAALAVANPAP